MLVSLPIREKDKLLLRLVAKDALLLEQLNFQHLEAGQTTDERVDDVRAIMRRYVGSDVAGLSPGELMMQLRAVSGKLTKHVKVTKDTLGEVQLTVEMLHLALDQHLASMRKRFRSANRWEKFAPYLVKRVQTTINRANKLHPDLWMEFEGQLNDLLTMIHDCPELNEVAERLGLARRWEGVDG